MENKLLIINDVFGIAVFTAIFISFFYQWLLPWIAVPCMSWLIIDAYVFVKSEASFSRTFDFIADVLFVTAFVFLPLFVPPSPSVLTTIAKIVAFSVPPLAILRYVLDIIDVRDRE